MATQVWLKRHDTLPGLSVTLEDAAGSPVNLTGAAVVFTMTPIEGGAPVVNRQPCVITNAAGGVVSYAWQPTDTATAGTYRGEFEADWGGGQVQTFPNDDYVSISILPDLG